MSDRSTRRHLLRTGLALPWAAGMAALSGCFGGAGQPHVLWELWPDDGGSADGPMQPMRVSVAADARRSSLSLVVEGVAAGELYDGTALVFSRSPGMRSRYQHASWTERPALRVARLVQRELQARGGFRDVTLADSGVAPDLMLTLTLVELYHDVPANEMRVELGAALVDWQRRRLVASENWRLAEALASADAAGAAAAAGRAMTRLLDEVVVWVESASAGGEGQRLEATGQRGAGNRSGAAGRRRALAKTPVVPTGTEVRRAGRTAAR